MERFDRCELGLVRPGRFGAERPRPPVLGRLQYARLDERERVLHLHRLARWRRLPGGRCVPAWDGIETGARNGLRGAVRQHRCLRFEDRALMALLAAEGRAAPAPPPFSRHTARGRTRAGDHRRSPRRHRPRCTGSGRGRNLSPNQALPPATRSWSGKPGTRAVDLEAGGLKLPQLEWDLTAHDYSVAS